MTATHVPPEQTVAEPVRWLWLLPRWSLVLGVVTLALPIVFFGGLGQQVSDKTLGAENAELLQAVRSPGMYRVGWTLDAVVWLMIGGRLLTLAGILRRRAPIRASFIAACGIGQLTGALGSLLRLNGTSDLAALYATASPAQQAVLLESNLNLWRVISSHYLVGTLLQGTGYLRAAWGVFSLRGFPRWLAVWLALPGLLAVVQFIFVTAGAPFSLPLNILDVIVGTIALSFAMAVALWRPRNQEATGSGQGCHERDRTTMAFKAIYGTISHTSGHARATPRGVEVDFGRQCRGSTPSSGGKSPAGV